MDPTVSQILQAPDLSLRHLVMQADPVVKLVMALLVLFSVWCWAIVVEKTIEFARAVRAVGRLEDTLRARDLGGLVNLAEPHPIALVIQAGTQEWRDGPGVLRDEIPAETRERIERAMELEYSHEQRRLQKRLPFLATVGSAAPFIGLFGTVWGIMNSFTSIAAQHDTSLAVVAPGIAEALLATGIGLLAAIPAVMAYNKFATELARLNGRMSAAIGAYGGLLAKQPLPRAE
jgi:biopolymer transport protein TolQ